MNYEDYDGYCQPDHVPQPILAPKPEVRHEYFEQLVLFKLGEIAIAEL